MESSDSASASSASDSSASAAPATFALTFGVPSCLSAHVLKHNKLGVCSLCGDCCDNTKACGDPACSGSSTVCAACFDCVKPNTQAAFFLAADAPLGDYSYDKALDALIRITVDKGNVVPLDGAQIAGLKLHSLDVAGGFGRDTRDALIDALLHMHNTEESHAKLRAKAADLADQVATADAAIVDAKRQLQQLERDADLLKRSHTTLSQVIDTNQLRPFGLLPRPPVVPVKVRPLRRVSAAPAAVEPAEAAAAAAPTAREAYVVPPPAADACVAAPPPIVHDAREVHGAAAEPAAAEDDDGAEPPTAEAADFPDFGDTDFTGLDID
jgi:hypothetical protein